MTSESNQVRSNYDLPSASQTEVLKQENPEVTHGNQYSFPSSTPGQGYTFDTTQLLNPSFPQSQTLTQMQTPTPFSNVMVINNNKLIIQMKFFFNLLLLFSHLLYIFLMQQAAYTNSLPSTLLAANGHPVGESDLSYSPFPISQQMPTKYGSSTISMAEVFYYFTQLSFVIYHT